MLGSSPNALLAALAAPSSSASASSSTSSALASLLGARAGNSGAAAFGAAAAASSASSSPGGATDLLAPFSSRAALLARPCPAGLEDTEEAADLLLLRQLDRKLRAGRDAVQSMRAAASATTVAARKAVEAAAAAGLASSSSSDSGSSAGIAAADATAAFVSAGDDDDAAVDATSSPLPPSAPVASEPSSSNSSASPSSSPSSASAIPAAAAAAASDPASPSSSSPPSSTAELTDPSNTGATSSADAVSSFLKSLGHTGVLSREAELRLAQVVCKGVAAEARAEAEAARLGRAPSVDEVAAALALRGGVPHLELLLANRQAATDLMVQFNLRLVFHCAKRYQGLGLEMSDLIAEGVSGLTRAIDKFDAARGNRFSTYAMWWIRQAVTRSISEQSRVIRLPVHIYEAVARIRRAAREVGGACDSPEQLHAAVAAETGLKVEKVERYLSAARGASSIDAAAPGPSKSGRGNGTEPADALSELLPCAASFSAADRRDAAERDAVLAAALDAVLASLPQRERNVLRMRYGLGGRRGRTMTLSDISAAYGVTTERIRQIEDSGLRRLRESGRAEGVATAAALIGEGENRDF